MVNFSKWNVENVQTMNGMFYGCNITNLEDISNMFFKCNSLEDLPFVHKWEKMKDNKIKNKEGLFGECRKLHLFYKLEE